MSAHQEREERRQGGSGESRGKPNAPDWEILEGWAVILGFFKWCSFAACVACFLSNALAWPWLAIGVVAWVGASWTRYRGNRAFERRYGPTPPPAPYIPAKPGPPRRSLGTAESILIGVLLGGLLFGDDEGEE